MVDRVQAYAMPAMRQGGRLGFGTLLIILYLVVTRIGGLEAGKIGIQIGPMPLYLTDIFILALFAFVLLTYPARLVMWLAFGGAAGVAGLMVWLLFGMSVVYAAIAWPEWKILAIRDLAIFGYSLIFPLAYFACDTGEKAAAVIRAMTYAGVCLAVVLILDTTLGLHIWFSPQNRYVTAEDLEVTGYGTGDTGGLIAFALTALLGFLIIEPRHRARHAVMLWICLLGVAIPQTRAAFFGLMMAGAVSLFCMGTLARAAFISGAILSGILGAFFVVYLPETGLSKILSGYVTAIIGGAGLASDPNFYFRLLRWNAVVRLWLDNPIFGVGFGIPLVPTYLIQREEVGINSGLPHNTFLTTLARLGFFGLTLVLIPWLHAFFRAALNFRSRRYPGETLAAALMLICMLGYANFVLFLERPIHAAALWIVAAAACRLAAERA